MAGSQRNACNSKSSSFERWLKNIQDDVKHGYNLIEYRVEDYECSLKSKIHEDGKIKAHQEQSSNVPHADTSRGKSQTQFQNGFGAANPDFV